VKVVLGPGASGGVAGLAGHIEGLRRRGVDAEAIQLPMGKAERAVSRFSEHRDALIGGHSYGGRVASLAAAEAEFPALLLFSFPLSGRPAERTAHFPRIACPVLMLSGDRDPMSPAAQLQEAAKLLPNGRLVLLPGAGHILRGQLEPALDLAAEFVHSLER
jgi:predicted alpha/beta-hydrolase family hydrolase